MVNEWLSSSAFRCFDVGVAMSISSLKEDVEHCEGLRQFPPGPKGYPFIGNLLPFARDPFSFVLDSTREYGDFVGMELMGRRAVLVNSPAGVEQVLHRDFGNFIKNKFYWRHFTAVFGLGLVTSDGRLWRRQRKLVAPAFTPRRIATYDEPIIEHTERMIASWEQAPERDIHDDMMAITLAIAADLFFRANLTSDLPALRMAMHALIAESAIRRKRPFVIPDWVPLPSNRRYNAALAVIDRIVWRLIHERKKSGVDGGDLLSAMIAARDADGQPMSDQQLRDQVVTLLLAGHETTALVLSWTFYLLGRHPDVADRMVAEADQVLGARHPTSNDLPRLQFTKQVLLEVMRLYPSIWIFGREAVEGCELGGYWLKAGDMAIVCPWLMHRDERYFESPLDFLPERWDENSAKKPPAQAYFPFSMGPRICIGMQFAMLEATLILATVLRRYKVTLQSDDPILPTPSISLRPRGGVHVRLQPRTGRTEARASLCEKQFDSV